MPELVDPRYLGVLIFAGAMLGFALGLAADWWVESRRATRKIIQALRGLPSHRSMSPTDLAELLEHGRLNGLRGRGARLAED